MIIAQPWSTVVYWLDKFYDFVMLLPLKPVQPEPLIDGHRWSGSDSIIEIWQFLLHERLHVEISPRPVALVTAVAPTTSASVSQHPLLVWRFEAAAWWGRTTVTALLQRLRDQLGRQRLQLNHVVICQFTTTTWGSTHVDVARQQATIAEMPVKRRHCLVHFFIHS